MKIKIFQIVSLLIITNTLFPSPSPLIYKSSTTMIDLISVSHSITQLVRRFLYWIDRTSQSINFPSCYLITYISYKVAQSFSF